MNIPFCPTCHQPATQAIGAENKWECRNESCPEYGQILRADEPEVLADYVELPPHNSR